MISLLLATALQTQDLKYRWVYYQTNLQVRANCDSLKGMMARAKKAGYNGFVIADSKLERLSDVPDFYFTNAKDVIQTAKDLGIDLIPAYYAPGYASGILSNNPNLIESMPVRGATYVAKGREAQLEPDAKAVYKNGDFEQVTNNKFQGFGFQDSIGTSTFADHQTVHGGQTSLRMQDPIVGAPDAGNCRIVQEIPVTPHRQYHLSAWIKTENFDNNNEFWIRVFNPKMRGLCEQSPGVQRTQDWKQVHITFNSQDNDTARIYIGVWGGKKGTLWLDDVKLEEAGLLNVVRRKSCPVTVKGEDGTIFEEGKDYEQIVDPKMGNVPWPGSYEIYHPSPNIKLTTNSRIKEGQHLKVDFNAAVVLSDGQVSICLSDPETRKWMADMTQRVDNLFHPKQFFLGYDEMRVGNWCDACQAQNKTAGQLLADDAKYAFAQVEKQHPGAETFAWNDMFDPNHNAVDNYYMTRGTLAGSWEGLPKKTVVVNWYFGNRAKSLPFFAKLGNKQLLAGYYDANPADIRTWLDDAKRMNVPVAGVMYTTWRSDFSNLEAFAKSAWGS